MLLLIRPDLDFISFPINVLCSGTQFRHHPAFHVHVSLASFDLWQFLSLFLFHRLYSLEEFWSGMQENVPKSRSVWCFPHETGVMEFWKECLFITCSYFLDDFDCSECLKYGSFCLLILEQDPPSHAIATKGKATLQGISKEFHWRLHGGKWESGRRKKLHGT